MTGTETSTVSGMLQIVAAAGVYSFEEAPAIGGGWAAAAAARLLLQTGRT